MDFVHKKELAEKFYLARDSFRINVKGISANVLDYDADNSYTDSLSKLLLDWIHLENLVNALSDLVPNQEIEFKYGKVQNNVAKGIFWKLEVFCSDKRFLSAVFIYSDLEPEDIKPFQSAWKVDSYIEIG